MEYKVNIFRQLLLQENKLQNLISRRDPDREVDKHIEDSLAILNFMSIGEMTVVDLGSGAGFPGLVLAIVTENSRFALIESDKKKSGFLQRVKLELNLKNVEIVNQRAEEIGVDPEFRGTNDLCISRAVAILRTLLEYSMPLLKQNGRAVFWKGSNCHKELEEAQKAMNVLGAKYTDECKYTLMDSFDRSLLIFEKISPTPSQFPRRVGLPTKRPI